MARTFVAIFTTFVLACAFVPAAAAQETVSPEKRAAVLRILELTKATDLAKEMIVLTVSQTTQLLRKLRPDIPESVLEALPKELSGLVDERMPAFVEMVIPVYASNFTLEDLKAIIAFYESDAGRRMIEFTPKVAKESSAIGQKWGESLGPALQERLKKYLESRGVKI